MNHAIDRRIRAPQDDGAALLVPLLHEAVALVEENRQGRKDVQESPHSRWLAGLAVGARRELLECALQHTGQYRDTSFASLAQAGGPFVLSGHQPELFHPGVWFKNFVLSALAVQTGAVPINLIIDTDAVHGIGIRVPSTEAGQVQAPVVPFDALGTASAWEERQILDRELFASFPQRVQATLARIAPQEAGGDLLVRRVWEALPERSSSERLGLVLARARHVLEAEYGLQTLEVPMSRVAQTASFRRFAFHLLGDARRLRATYNSALAEYRQRQRIRSHSHPVPALVQHAEWEEVPFFVWTASDLRRRPLYVRPQGNALVLTDRGALELCLELSPDRASEQLAAYEGQGIKIRPRALVTTLYARLLLSDAFVHGIGGAKYDELTDVLMEQHFGISPPAFITATATFRLPLEAPRVFLEHVRAGQRRLRDLRFRAESFVDEPLLASEPARRAALAHLALAKRSYLQEHSLRHGSSSMYQGLEALNRAMGRLLEPLRGELEARQVRLLRDAAATKLLTSREYSFVLFNSELLPARLLDLCKVLS